METFFTDQFGILRLASNKGTRPASTRPTITPPTAPRRPSPPARVGYRSAEPRFVCAICYEPRHLVAGTLRCADCASEVRWRVALARSGLRVVA